MARMISVRTALAIVLGAICGLLAALLYVTDQQVTNTAEQAAAEAGRTTSYRLAEQMRESSEDLTTMVRLYVSTGEERYRQYFEQILAIRNGTAPRPKDYDASFWNRVLAHGTAGVQYDPPKSLDQMMREAHFTDDEFAMLNASREISDGLARIETEVIHGVQALALKPDDAAYAARAQPLYQRLVGPEYFDYKSRIMQAVQRFITLVDERTLTRVQDLRVRHNELLRMQIALVAALFLVGLCAFIAASRGLVRPLQRLIEVTQRIAAGEYGQRATRNSVRELAQLGAHFNEMAAAVQSDIARRQEAERRALEAQAEAERANHAKGSFLANMSHEIRTPLNAVIGMSELLRDTRLDAEQHDYVETINGSGEHLLSVINDILDYTKVEAGMLELDEQVFDLRRTIEESLDLVAGKAAEKRLDLACEFAPETPEVVKADRGRVRQILVNYLSNAIKFTERGDVVVTISSTPLDAGRHLLRAAVRDSGIGIPADRRDRLFKSFSQVDASTTRRYGGTGLGLAICKRLAELMGGGVEVDSHPGLGSIFSFTFAAGTDPGWRAPPRSDTAILAGKRLLVVDDNDTNRRILRNTAQEWGMRVVDTAFPAEALRMIEAGERFDLAALDYLMPEMDGVELGAAIRRHLDHEQLPLMLFSSVRRTARTLPDFDLVLLKPLRRAALLDGFVELLSGAMAEAVQTPLGAAAHAAVPMPPTALRILLVEDNPVNQKVALRMLEVLGYAADVAENGLLAVQAVERQRYDLVLMDVQMPVMDGLEATRRIRRMPEEQQPRIFAMTASVLDSERQECIDAGMERHLAKPIRKRQLEDTLREVAEAGGVALRSSAPAPAAAEVDAADGIDENALAQLVDEVGSEGAAEVIGAMVDGAALACQVLREAWTAQDLKVVKRQAHTMKANCAMVGASRLAADCSRLERLLPDLGTGEVRNGFQDLLLSVGQRYEALAGGLAQWRQRAQAAGG